MRRQTVLKPATAFDAPRAAALAARTIEIEAQALLALAQRVDGGFIEPCAPCSNAAAG